MKLINPRTRKEYKGLAVPVKRKFPEPIEYVSMFQHGLEHIARLKLTPTESAVLLIFLSRLEYENWIRVSQKTIGKKLNLSKSQVSNAVKKLVETGILQKEQDPSDEGKLLYRFNPSLGWRGETKEWFESTTGKEFEPIPPCYVRSNRKS